VKSQISNLKFQKGFTLIEAIVSSAVFGFVIVSVLGIYILVINLDSRTRGERAVQQNGRYIMEYLAKEIRNGLFDYASYPSANANNTDSSIWLINQLNESERLYLSGTDLKLEKNVDGTIVTTNINSASVRITNLKFYLSPPQNPLTSAKTFNQQPSVTVIMELTSNYGQKTGDVVKLSLQSTFTSRDYPSREP
jgi:prepilin-type N-terminal cleavage/methylation domain-containing protein